MSINKILWLARTLILFCTLACLSHVNTAFCTLILIGNASTTMTMHDIEILKQLADTKDADAMTKLGQMYLQGNEWIGQDTQKGIQLLEHAANLGTPEAIYTLGNVYSQNILVPKDLEYATQLYEQALRLGYAEANAKLLRVTIEKYIKLIPAPIFWPIFLMLSTYTFHKIKRMSRGSA